MNIQWFPGHMAKTRRLIIENLKLADVVIELLDSRLPEASRNPEVNAIIGQKPRVIVLNKCDIADAKTNEQWVNFFKQQGIIAVLVDSVTGKGLSALLNTIPKVLAEKLERSRQKGIDNPIIKMMVVGIPNVGKSSFINKIVGRPSAKTGNRPGVTVAKQWVRLLGKYELLDTPGILWPKFDDPEVGKKIAYTGGIKDEILDAEELACCLLDFLRVSYQQNLCDRYKLDLSVCELLGYELLELIGKKRGLIISGGQVDTFRAANMILDEFRSAKLGNISLEAPS